MIVFDKDDVITAMRRKVLYWSLITLLLFGLLAWWFWPREWLTEELLAKIKPGMMLSQAKEVLGEPFDRSEYYPATCRYINTNRGSFLDYFYYSPRSAWLPIISLATPLSEEESDGLVQVYDRKTRELWVGRTKMLIVKLDGEQVITKIWIFPVQRHGGNLWDGPMKQYEKWRLADSRPIPTITLPASQHVPK